MAHRGFFNDHNCVIAVELEFPSLKSLIVTRGVNLDLARATLRDNKAFNAARVAVHATISQFCHKALTADGY